MIERVTAADARWASRTFFATGVLASALYLAIGRRLWFTRDDWDFLGHRTLGSFHSLFSSHLGHWCTIPIVVYRLLWSVVGLRSYMPYQACAIALHFLAAWLIRRIMLRAGVGPWVATGAALVLVLFGRGEDDILSAFQITYVGAFVFGVTHLLLADHDGPLDRRDGFGLAAGAAALMCSAVAVTMITVVGIASLLRRGWRVAAAHTVPLGVLYLIWLTTMQDDGRATGTSLLARVRFVITTPFNALDAMGSYRGVGWLLAILLVVGLVIASGRCAWSEWTKRYAAPVALLLGAGVFLVATSIGRAGRITTGFRPRYLDITLAMMLPALAIAADAVMRIRRAFILPVLALLLVGIPSNLRWISRDTALQQDRLLLLLRADQAPAAKLARCRNVPTPITVRLKPKATLRVANGTIRIAPKLGDISGLYPIRFQSGTVLTPRRSVLTFRVMPTGTGLPRVCEAP